MLDVDGNVISSEELVRRVEQHVSTIGPTSTRCSMGSPHCERLRRQRSTRHLFAACGRFNPELGLRTSDNQRA